MWTDTKSGYGLISIVLHWLAAGLVIVLWWIGNSIEDAPEGNARTSVQNLHFALGMLALLILVPRLLWRAANARTPLVATNSALLDVIAKIVKWGLLAALMIMVISGPLTVWASNRGAIDVFGLIIPNPLPSILNDHMHHRLEVIHKLTSKAILVLVGLHVLGTLKHLIIDRDGILRRMLVPAKNAD